MREGSFYIRLAAMRGLALRVGSTAPWAGTLTAYKGEREKDISFLTLPLVPAAILPTVIGCLLNPRPTQTLPSF